MTRSSLNLILVYAQRTGAYNKYEVFDSLNEDTYESGVPECSKILIDDCIINILDIE